MKKCYCGYLTNGKSLALVASGGLATALAHHVIDKEGVVYGVAYSEDFRSVRFMRVATKDEIVKLQGSKYIRSTKKLSTGETVYQAAYHDLLHGKRLLFIGLPCEIAALIHYLNTKAVEYHELLTTVDLICHGPTVPQVAVQFIDALEAKYRAKVVDFSVRYKNPNWTPPYLRAEFSNGKVYCKKFYLTDYGRALALFSLPQCYQCRFKGDQHVADITIGDYWGITQKDQGYNIRGVSVAMVSNPEVEKLLLTLQGFDIFAANYQTALDGNPMYSHSRTTSAASEKFSYDFFKYGLHKACKRSYTLRETIGYKLLEPILSLLKGNQA